METRLKMRNIVSKFVAKIGATLYSVRVGVDDSPMPISTVIILRCRFLVRFM